MAEITRSQLAVYAVIALGIVLLGGRYLTQQHQGGGSPAPGVGAAPVRSGGPQVRVPSTRSGTGVVVHVAGAVRHPGVYRIRGQGRVRDAVRRAGGAMAQGDANAINLAAKVADGQQVVIPRRAPIAVVSAPPGAAPAPAGGAPGAGVVRTPISLSSATPEQLQELDGVGPATADKIVAWRTEHGGFRSVDDLGQVPGIGAKRLATLRPLVQP